MDPNPIYWLETRQARRNYVLWILTGVGVVMGIYLVFLALAETPHYMLGYANLIPFVFYVFGPLMIALGSSQKLAVQLIEEDLILRTPISPAQILWAKLFAALRMIFYLHIPCIPGIVLIAVNDFEFGFGWAIASLSCILITICLTLAGLGFMAGSRTILLRGVLVCFAGIFVFCGMIVSAMLFAFLIGMIAESVGYQYIDTYAPFVYVCVAAFDLFFSLLIFLIGIKMLERDPNLRGLAVAGWTIAVFALFIIFVFAAILTKSPGFALGAMIPWAGFFAAPLIAMQIVHSNNAARFVAVPLPAQAHRIAIDG